MILYWLSSIKRCVSCKSLYIILLVAHSFSLKRAQALYEGNEVLRLNLCHQYECHYKFIDVILFADEVSFTFDLFTNCHNKHQRAIKNHSHYVEKIKSVDVYLNVSKISNWGCCRISGLGKRRMWLQQDEVLPHFNLGVCEYLNLSFHDLIMG